MRVIGLEGIEVLAGLEWTALPTEMPERRAMSEFLSQNKGPRSGVVIRSNGITVVGRNTSPLNPAMKKKAKGLPSAAALLALASQRMIKHIPDTQGTTEENNWIVVEKIISIDGRREGDDELFWLGAVKNGVPIPGADIIGSRQSVVEEILLLVSQLPNWVVYTVDKDIRYEVVAQVQVLEKHFVDFVRGVEKDKAKITLFSKGLIVAGVILGASLIVAGLWWGVSTYQQKQLEERQRLQALAEQQAQQELIKVETEKYEETVRQAMIDGLKEGMDEVTFGLASPSPSQVIHSWRNVLYDIDLYQSGWVINGINCIIENETPKCSLSLTRGDLGINRLLLNEHPDSIIDGNEASYSIAAPNMAKRTINWQDIPSSTTFSKTLLSELQSLRSAEITHTVESSKDIVKVVPLPPAPSVLNMIPGISPDSDPNVEVNMDPNLDPANQEPGSPPTSITIQLGFANGKLTIGGAGLWQLAGIASYLDRPNLRANALAINFNSLSPENSSWTLELDYFVRTLSQPVIPTVNLPDRTIVIELPGEYRSQGVSEGGVTESSVEATTAIGDLELSSEEELTPVLPPPPK